ncbi:Fur-regulated basic protein FbpA [Bacillus paranthracis]|nr:Fur-regulated basic protein FbpA [Bacillus cereus group sp. BY25LC]MDA1828561.1 Fur-regulated basic protein FbpA [Bacillus cereus group sp. BY25LC]
MDKQCIIEQLIDKGIFKQGKRQLWELHISELVLLLEEAESESKGMKR